MAANKYGNFLTILLVVLIVVIIIGVGLLVYNYVIKPKIDDDRTIEAIKEFDRNTEENKDEKPEEEEPPTGSIAPSENSGGSETTIKKTYYQGFVMLGYITMLAMGYVR